jgi:hypothetical protein
MDTVSEACRRTGTSCENVRYRERQDKDNDILTRQTFVIPYNKVFPLKTISWGSKNIPINIPNDPEWYLRYQYGETWKIPRPGDKGKEGIDQGNWNYSFLYGNMYKFIATLAGLPLLLK